MGRFSIKHMPNYFYNSNFPDAAAYGQGLGNSLGQAMIGLPQKRAEMAMQLAQLQHQNMMAQALMGYRQQQLGSLDNYRQGELTNRQNAIGSVDQYRQGELANKQQQLGQQDQFN